MKPIIPYNIAAGIQSPAANSPLVPNLPNLHGPENAKVRVNQVQHGSHQPSITNRLAMRSPILAGPTSHSRMHHGTLISRHITEYDSTARNSTVHQSTAQGPSMGARSTLLIPFSFPPMVFRTRCCTVHLDYASATCPNECSWKDAENEEEIW